MSTQVERQTAPPKTNTDRTRIKKRLITTILVLQSALSAKAGLSAAQIGQDIVVESKGKPSWRAVVDGKQTGSITNLSFLPDGENVTRCLFGAFYMGKLEDGNGNVSGKGGLSEYGSVESARIIRQSDTEVVVETKGSGTGKALIGGAGEKVIEFRNRITFREAKIGFEGEYTWVYPHGSKMIALNINSIFAPHQIQYPVKILSKGVPPVELQVDASSGDHLPAGIAYPLSVECYLKNGLLLKLNTLEVPKTYDECRKWTLERPWHSDWEQGVELIGDGLYTGPTTLKYEYEILQPAAGEKPPAVKITSPGKESADRGEADYKLGDMVKLAAEVTDPLGKPLKDEDVAWSVFVHVWEPPLEQIKGRTGTFVLKDNAEGELKANKAAIIRLDVKGSNGLKGYEYTGIKVKVD